MFGSLVDQELNFVSYKSGTDLILFHIWMNSLPRIIKNIFSNFLSYIMLPYTCWSTLGSEFYSISIVLFVYSRTITIHLFGIMSGYLVNFPI